MSQLYVAKLKDLPQYALQLVSAIPVNQRPASEGTRRAMSSQKSSRGEKVRKADPKPSEEHEKLTVYYTMALFKQFAIEILSEYDVVGKIIEKQIPELLRFSYRYDEISFL